MQFKSTHTKEEILNSDFDNPFDFIDSPIKKVECVAEIIRSMNQDMRNYPFCELPIGAVLTLGEILTDAVADLKYLNQLCADETQRIEEQRDELAEKLKALMPAVDLAKKLKVEPSRIVGQMKKGAPDAS